MTRDMTSGNPTKLLLEFSIPMLIGNFFQQFYSMVDTIVVGKTIGVDALAAVGSTGSINFMIIGFIIGLSNGFGIMVAQRFGANDKNGVKKAVTMSVYLSLFMAIVVTALSLITSMPLLRLLNTPANIIHDANLYISIIYIGIIATISYNLIASILRAFGNSKAPFYIMIISSLANIVFNLLFILVFKLGVAGSAIATDSAQVLSCILGFMVLRKHEMLKIKKLDWTIDFTILKKLFILGIPAAIQNSVTALGCMLLQAIVNGYGAIYVAGYTAGTKIMSLVEQPGITFGLAMATFSGQNLGAKKYDRISLGIRKCIKMSVIVNIIISLLIIIFRHQIISLFVSPTETGVFKVSGQYMIVTSIFVCDLGLLFIYRSALQGMGNTVIPMISGVLELALRLLFGLTLPIFISFLGICFAEVSAWVGAELLLMISYYIMIRKLKHKF
ncbi:MATE family efflux transporter [Clostridium oryzae]|uniref:Probable multidrug resistance protein NorM n=1 Tax=Clostridium oryzae TaxID=1450648 RepID=A0A1V4IQ32_9CLOT|nr:MATE family efflux transporter [Clostridium oryzae]OPJ61930.1 multidrug resistance protein NorM [Clostridium oryzae]